VVGVSRLTVVFLKLLDSFGSFFFFGGGRGGGGGGGCYELKISTETLTMLLLKKEILKKSLQQVLLIDS
jgi:hypothetical protein